MMELSRERIYHNQAQPRAGALRITSAPDPSTTSQGTARSDRNVDQALNSSSNLGVRVWPSSTEVVDDLYGEPTGEEFQKPPYQTLGIIKFDESSDKELNVQQYGQEFRFRARMTIPVIEHVENDLPEPYEGDMLEFWANSWHEFGVFYNVTKVDRGGFIGGSNYHTEWKLTLTRNEDFVPERRLLGHD